MGKKYIVELESGTHIFVLGPEGITHIGEPDVVYNTVDGMQIGDAVINAKPYTEPDLEQVRKEAYAEGFKDGQYAEKMGLIANCAKEQETIQVGDVVRVKNAPDVEIWVTDISDEDGGLLSGLALKTVDDNCDMGDTYANRNIYNFERTGKHYDVPTVLENMRGEQDG